MSLADELLADLEDDGLGDIEEQQGIDQNEVMEVAVELESVNSRSVRDTAKLLDSAELKAMILEIEKYTSEAQAYNMKGPIEAHPEKD